MDHAETVAKFILEAAIPGAAMTFRPKQSHGEYDFDLRYPNGDIAAVEVTSSMDRNRKWTIDKIYGKKKGGPCIDAVQCKKNWLIFLSNNAPVQEIRKEADKYLAELEAAGLECFSHTDPFNDSQECARCLRYICNDLKLERGTALNPAGASPKICMVGAGGGGAFNELAAIEAWEQEAQKSDNRKKLEIAKTSGRHLVVYVDHSNGLPYIALTSLEPPPIFPNLPAEITHAWLVSEHEKSDRFVIWRGSKNECWRKIILPAETNPNGADSSASPAPQ